MMNLTRQRTKETVDRLHHEIYVQTDRLFAVLMAVQWVAGVAAAYWISPRTWVGTTSEPSIHIWAATVLGGAISSLPIAMVIFRPGSALTRHTVAVGQMLTSALLIHLSGGRIETHFHVFGSLAFLAFYRDWTVLLTATLVVSGDHALRGMLWPQSVYGVLTRPLAMARARRLGRLRGRGARRLVRARQDADSQRRGTDRPVRGERGSIPCGRRRHGRGRRRLRRHQPGRPRTQSDVAEADRGARRRGLGAALRIGRSSRATPTSRTSCAWHRPRNRR